MNEKLEKLLNKFSHFQTKLVIEQSDGQNKNENHAQINIVNFDADEVVINCPTSETLHPKRQYITLVNANKNIALTGVARRIYKHLCIVGLYDEIQVKELRQNPRYNLKDLVQVELVNLSHVEYGADHKIKMGGVIQNISIKGCMIEFKEPIELDKVQSLDQLEVYFSLGDEHFKISSRLAHKGQLENKSFYVAVEFLKPLNANLLLKSV